LISHNATSRAFAGENWFFAPGIWRYQCSRQNSGLGVSAHIGSFRVARDTTGAFGRDGRREWVLGEWRPAQEPLAELWQGDPAGSGRCRRALRQQLDHPQPSHQGLFFKPSKISELQHGDWN